MIELWGEAPERRMGYKQEIEGSQNLRISESQITVRKKHVSLSEYL